MLRNQITVFTAYKMINGYELEIREHPCMAPDSKEILEKVGESKSICYTGNIYRMIFKIFGLEEGMEYCIARAKSNVENHIDRLLVKAKMRDYKITDEELRILTEHF